MTIRSTEKKYWAFISYSSKDRKWGQWLHKRLENYPIPEEFRGVELFDGATLGKNLRPVFRDRDELSESADLGPAIHNALQQSRFLVVLDWKSGRDLGSLDIAYPEIIQDAKRVDDRVLIAIYHYNDETSTLSSWNWTGESPATPLKKDLPGTLGPLVVSEGDKAFTILSLLKKDAQRSLALFALAKDGGSLKQLDPLESADGDLAWIDDDPTEFADGLCHLIRKDGSARPNIFDAHTGSLYRHRLPNRPQRRRQRRIQDGLLYRGRLTGLGRGGHLGLDPARKKGRSKPRHYFPGSTTKKPLPSSSVGRAKRGKVSPAPI